MLVMERRLDEAVQVQCPCGRYTTITTVEIRKSKIKLGIDSPQDVRILRGEITSRGSDAEGQISHDGC